MLKKKSPERCFLLEIWKSFMSQARPRWPPAYDSVRSFNGGNGWFYWLFGAARRASQPRLHGSVLDLSWGGFDTWKWRLPAAVPHTPTQHLLSNAYFTQMGLVYEYVTLGSWCVVEQP